jgi:hypothetical protein
VDDAEPTVELWVDDHQEYEPGVVILPGRADSHEEFATRRLPTLAP